MSDEFHSYQKQKKGPTELKLSETTVSADKTSDAKLNVT